MRSRSTHQSDEMVVFLRADGIEHNISNALAVHFASSVKSKGNFDKLILQITVNSFWATNNLSQLFNRSLEEYFYFCWAVVCKEVLREQTGISIGVVSSNNNQTIKLEGFAVLFGVLELLWSLDLVSTGA